MKYLFNTLENDSNITSTKHNRLDENNKQQIKQAKNKRNNNVQCCVRGVLVCVSSE